MKRISWLIVWSSFVVKATFGYGALSEFISADGSTYRNTSLGASILSTDRIVNPVWATASFPLQLTLCTGGSFISSNVKYQTTKTTELLADITTAQNSWSFGTGTELAFLSPTTDACNSTSGYDSSHRMVYFASLGAGILAVAPTTISVQSGELVITDGDIIFNSSLVVSGSTLHFLTHSCDTAGAPSGTCTGSTLPLTFLGILTHEMGHLVGISHTVINDDNNSDGLNSTPTMYPAVSNIADTRASESLELDDQLGRENLYPTSDFPANTGGVVSGNVMRTATLGNRGAHISIFDLSNKRTLTGGYTSITGTRANPTGEFSIRGVPFNTPFAVFVEPTDRSGDGLSTTYQNINTPIEAALQTELDGFLDFQMEAYPDVAIPDVRLLANANLSPTFSSAQSFEVTSSSSVVSGLTFYLSQSSAAPNDAADAELQFNSSLTITNDNPLTITLSNPSGLAIFSNPTVTLTATRDTETTNWTAGLPSFTYSGTSASAIVDPSLISVSNGVYSLLVTLVDSEYGTLSGTANIRVTNWTSNIAGTSASSGGCNLGVQTPNANAALILMMGFILILASLRYRKSFTSRASILSKPKQS